MGRKHQAKRRKYSFLSEFSTLTQNVSKGFFQEGVIKNLLDHTLTLPDAVTR